MNERPKLETLATIRPENAGTGEDALTYEDLIPKVEIQAPYLASRETEAWNSEPNTLEEQKTARDLAIQYFLMGAAKGLITPDVDKKDLWAGRFTGAASELYGVPEKDEVLKMLGSEYAQLLTHRGSENISQPHVEFLLETYRPLVDVAANITPVAEKTTYDHETLTQYGNTMREKYEPLFEMVDKEEYTSAELGDLFDQALEWLAENDDPEWKEWKTLRQDGTMLAVLSSKKLIKIANQRTTADRVTTKGLIAHELLVHALRAVRGAKTSDPRMASGLSGYLDSEEGLGILSEAAINGAVPTKAYDRYVDVALALGIIDGKQRTRKQLFEISYARQLIRKQSEGGIDEAAEDNLTKGVWGHIDRLYRGDARDDTTKNQAVYTIDIAYYAGYKKMIDYITAQLAEGKTSESIFEYLSRGKFDPTNIKHTAIVDHL